MSKSRPLFVGSNAAITWQRVDPDVRTQTWVQVCDVNSDSNGAFVCDIVFKETDPSYQKPLTGGYSLTRARKLKLQWQSNGQYSGIFRRYFTSGTDVHDGSFFVDETSVRNNWSRVFQGFPNLDVDGSAQIGVYRIWGKHAPPSTFLGNVVATITTVDKICRR